MNVSNQIISGVKFASFSKIIRIGLQYVTLLILVAYLSPTDFGLMSTAMIFIGFFNLIKDFGFSSALIQLEEKTDELLSSVFWLNAVIGISLATLLYFASGFVANFYKIAELKLILEVLSINFIFSSISTLQNALFEKEMRFNIISKIEIISSSTASIVAITLAVLDFGVWALVFQTLTLSFLMLFFNWLYSDFRPKIVFSVNEIKKILHFGINLSGFNILNYFVRNADYFLIGKFLGMNELGLYSLAYRIMLFPIQNISSVVNRVVYPALSKVKNNKIETRKIYTNIVGSVAFFTFPLTIGFFVINESFVTLFLSERWYPIIDILYVLVPIGLIQSVYSLAGAIYLSQDQTKLWFKWGIISAMITVTGFYIGIKWGIIGVAISYLATNIILIYPGSKIPFNLIELSFKEYLSKISITLLISLIMGGIVFLIKQLITNYLGNLIVSFIIMVLIGIITYLLLSYKFNQRMFENFRKAI